MISEQIDNLTRALRERAETDSLDRATFDYALATLAQFARDVAELERQAVPAPARVTPRDDLGANVVAFGRRRVQQPPSRPTGGGAA